MVVNETKYMTHLRRYYEKGVLISRDKKVNKFENGEEFSIISDRKMLNNRFKKGQR